MRMDVFVSALVSEQATEKFIKFVLVEKHLAGESITADTWEFGSSRQVAGHCGVPLSPSRLRGLCPGKSWPNRRSRFSQCQA